METQSLLEIRNLCAAYGSLEVLRGISLDIPPKRATAILGPNGSGKSTLLKAIIGLPDVQITAGSIWFSANDWTNLSLFQRIQSSVVYLPQSVDVFPQLTVEENLLIFLGEIHKGKRKISLDAAYALFPFMGTKRKQAAGNLSGGERRLIAIARAILSNPDLLLLDEPSAGLAPSALAEVCKHIQEIVQRGTTVVMVEQNLAVALEIADECILLRDGMVRMRFTSDLFDTKRAEFMEVFSLTGTGDLL